MAKKKKANPPKRKQMSQHTRLQSGMLWLAKYCGKNPIRSYRNWYGVSEVCAILELRIIGLQIDDKRLEQAKNNEVNKSKNRAAIKERKKEVQYSDDNFSFIAGYTSGGAPYGVTWEEMKKID